MRVMRFRNSRIAKWFAEKYDGEYMGWIFDNTGFIIERKGEQIESIDGGAYVTFFKENEEKC